MENQNTEIIAKSKTFGKKFYIWSIVFLMIIGFIFRIENLSKQSYWMDEGYTVNAILSIKEHGSTILDSGKNYSCPTYCYPSYFLSLIFGDNAFSYRLLSVLAGVGLILATYLICKEFISKKVGLLSAFFVTFSYFEIAWSREARWYTLFSLLFILSIYFFYKYYKTKKNKYIIWTSIFTILTIFTHAMSIVLPAAFIIFLISENYKNGKKYSPRSILLGFTVIILTLALDYFSGIKLIYNNLINLSFSFNFILYLAFYLKNYSIFIILSIASLFLLHKHKEISNLFLIIILTYVIPLSFLTSEINYRYLFHLMPLVFILSSISVAYIYSKIKDEMFKITFLICIIILYFLIGCGIIYPQNFYALESDMPSTSWFPKNYYLFTPQPNWKEAYEFIKKDKTNDDIVISIEPEFNKIFLGEAGFYLKYSRNGLDDNQDPNGDGKEIYVGAKIINDLNELKEITKDKHGYIVFDFTYINRPSSQNILEYISEEKWQNVFFEETNEVSQIWVYKF